jgi:hypothetical protein
MAFMLRVNGTNRSIDGDTPLLRVLRDMLGKTGTKFGCDSRTGSSGTIAINKHRRFDPLTIAVRDRQTPSATRQSSPVRGWLVVIEDPDHNRVRLYTLETHGPELKPDQVNEWLQFD